MCDANNSVHLYNNNFDSENVIEKESLDSIVVWQIKIIELIARRTR